MNEKEFWELLEKAGFYAMQNDYEYVLNCISIFCDHQANLNHDNCLCEYYTNKGNKIYQLLKDRGYYSREVNTND